MPLSDTSSCASERLAANAGASVRATQSSENSSSAPRRPAAPRNERMRRAWKDGAADNESGSGEGEDDADVIKYEAGEDGDAADDEAAGGANSSSSAI